MKDQLGGSIIITEGSGIFHQKLHQSNAVDFQFPVEGIYECKLSDVVTKEPM